MAAYDILLGQDGDLPLTADGGLQLGLSDNQHITDAMVSFPGWWKQYPQNGIGLPKFFKSKVSPGIVLNKVEQQLANDGYTLVDPVVELVNGTLQVTPNAVRV